MNATQTLMNEHQVILRVINALEHVARSLDEGQAVRPGFFLDAADFIKGFADGCHHHKEEGVLFVAMQKNGLPVQGGPLGVMLAEHEQGRILTRGMRQAAELLQNGQAGAAPDVVSNALRYAALLRQHIAKEDNVLFPMADRVIPADQHEQVEQGFEQVEHEETGAGVHEKYLALAEKLEQEASLL